MKCIDLFAGIGGIRLGFSQVFDDLDCVFTSEINKYSLETYKANFDDELIYGDINLLEVIECVPEHNILMAGFPCQPFSQAGKRKGLDDPRGQLFYSIEKILKTQKPEVVFLENVKQLKGHNKGKTLQHMINLLENIGYSVKYDILSARDFGVPQNRERIYIVCFIDEGIANKFNFPIPPKSETLVGNILDKNVDDKYTISDKLWLGHQRRKAEHKAKGNGFGYSLFNDDSKYTNTISARYYKDGSEILIEQSGKNPRKLTPREASRLQGFPEDFNIPVSDTQAYRQFGNSVSVPVIKSIASEIKKALENK